MDDRRPAVAAQSETTWAACLLLVALLITSRQLPWALLAALPALGALALAVRATVLRVRRGARVAAVWSGIGVLFACYVLLGVAVQGVLYGPVDSFRRCTAGANTELAQYQCKEALRDELGSVGVALLDG